MKKSRDQELLDWISEEEKREAGRDIRKKIPFAGSSVVVVIRVAPFRSPSFRSVYVYV